VNAVAIFVLFYNYIAINFTERNLASVQSQTVAASNDLMLNAYNAMQSDTIRHMVRIQEILDELAKVDGTLVKYNVSGGNATIEALVPPAFAQDFGRPLGLERDGRVRVQFSR
jgi:hypothetical protein